MSRGFERPVRLFSVDGVHTVEHMPSRLVLAYLCIAPANVIILADILNVHWLGVTEGAVRFLMQRPMLMPFAIGHEQLLLVNLALSAAVLRTVRRPQLVHRAGRRAPGVSLGGYAASWPGRCGHPMT